MVLPCVVTSLTLAVHTSRILFSDYRVGEASRLMSPPRVAKDGPWT